MGIDDAMGPAKRPGREIFAILVQVRVRLSMGHFWKLSEGCSLVLKVAKI